MNTSESKKKMKDVSYAFFPVVAEGQYYVIVFNLLKANAEILDNEKDYDYNKYQEVFDSVKALFLKYLKKHQLADICTKALCRERHRITHQQVGMRSFYADTLQQFGKMRYR
ncbi:hypothetical protein Tco_0406964 [Tanacetum coccineum]